METRLCTTHNRRERGFTAIEVAIFMIAAMVVATIATVALLELGVSTSSAGENAANNGYREATGSVSLHGPVVAVRGDIDINGDDSIDLGGADTQAIVKLKMTLTADFASGIDLTAPYTVDDTGTDPDTSGLTPDTIISLTTSDLSVSSTAWSVEFVGTNDGDVYLERGERAEVTLWLHPNDPANSLYDIGAGSSDPFVDVEADLLSARGQFTVRIIPDGAPATVIARTLPIELTSTVLLD